MRRPRKGYEKLAGSWVRTRQLTHATLPLPYREDVLAIDKPMQSGGCNCVPSECGAAAAAVRTCCYRLGAVHAGPRERRSSAARLPLGCEAAATRGWLPSSTLPLTPATTRTSRESSGDRMKVLDQGSALYRRRPALREPRGRPHLGQKPKLTRQAKFAREMYDGIGLDGCDSKPPRRRPRCGRGRP